MILYTQGAIYVIPVGTTVRYQFAKELYKKHYTLLSLETNGMFLACVKGEENKKRKAWIFSWNIVDQLVEFIDTGRSIGVYSIRLSSYDEPLSSYDEPLSSYDEPLSSYDEPLSSYDD
jgi:hypothetical protein